VIKIDRKNQAAGDMGKADNKDSVYSKLARAALEECEERFRIFMETTKDGVVIHDRFKIIETNPAFADMFGYQLATILGRDVLEFIAPVSRDLIMEKLIAGDEGSLEVSGIKKDGSNIPIEFCSRIIPHGGNRINLTLWRQIQANIEAKPAEPEASDRLDPLFEFTPEAYYLADETGAFIDVNQATRELFGHKKEYFIGKSFLNLKIIAPDQIHRAARNLAINILGKPSEPEEYIIQHSDGRRIPVEISTRPVKLNKKNMMFGIVRDITEKKKYEEAMQRAVKEIESLVEERESGGEKADQKAPGKTQQPGNLVGTINS
jgi:PAS domain S-box-containing protein